MQNETEGKRRTSSFEDVGRRMDEEVERMVTYINDELVPQVRSHSSRAMRVAADRLSRLADYMDERSGGKTSASTADHERGSGI